MPPIPWPRAVAFLAIAAYIIAGPFYRQILHGRSEWFRPWVMYSGAGIDVCAIAWYSREADGDRLLDRFDTLGYRAVDDAPRSLRIISNRNAGLVIAAQLCDKLGDGTDLRAEGRCSTRGGWQTAFNRSKNLCVH